MAPEQSEPPAVVVLYNHSTSAVKGEVCDLIADQAVIQCATAVAAALRKRGFHTALAPIWAEPPLPLGTCDASGAPGRSMNGRTFDAELALAAYPPSDWVVFNLAEGLDGRLFEEVRIAWALEAMGYRFTGNDAGALGRTGNKVRAKLLLTERGVPTPAWLAFRHPDQVNEDVLMRLPFPLIVKPVAEDASLGIGPGAVVHTLKALRDRVAYVVECYRQVALVETFVVGREFNIALWGDPVRVLPLAEVDFSGFADPHDRIVSFAAKWEAESFEYRNTPVLCPAPVSPQLGARITRTARQAWAAVGCRGYARVDMRVDQDDTPYVVEINCNPDLSPDAGFARAARVAGYSYEDMIVYILQLALRCPSPYERAASKKGWIRQSSPGRATQRPVPHQAGLWQTAPEAAGVSLTKAPR